MWEVQQARAHLQGLAPEQQCERLSLKGIIAGGAFGTVHRGRWRGIDVAVKVDLDPFQGSVGLAFRSTVDQGQYSAPPDSPHAPTLSVRL